MVVPFFFFPPLYSFKDVVLWLEMILATLYMQLKYYGSSSLQPLIQVIHNYLSPPISIFTQQKSEILEMISFLTKDCSWFTFYWTALKLWKCHHCPHHAIYTIQVTNRQTKLTNRELGTHSLFTTKPKHSKWILRKQQTITHRYTYWVVTAGSVDINWTIYT